MEGKVWMGEGEQIKQNEWRKLLELGLGCWVDSCNG